MSRVASTSGRGYSDSIRRERAQRRAPRSGEAHGRHARPSSSGAPRSGGPAAPGGGAGACARRPPRLQEARVRPRARRAARAVRGRVPEAASSTATQSRPSKRARSQAPCSLAGSASGSHSARQSGSPASRSSRVSRYWPFAAARRPRVTRRASAPYPPRLCGERDEAQAVREPELAADDERQARLARGGMRAHDARERALVGQRERGVAERLRTLDEFRRMRRAPQEREIADAVQFRIRHRASRPRTSRVSRARVARPGLRSLARGT